MHSDCYENGHISRSCWPGRVCVKCGEALFGAVVNGHIVWHSQAEYDRYYEGVDREAARVLTEGGDE